MRALSRAEWSTLYAALRSSSVAPTVSRRCHAVLLAGKGQSAREIARHLKMSRRTVARWLDAFDRGGVPAVLAQQPRGRRVSGDTRARIAALQGNGAERRITIRATAAMVGVSPTTVFKVWGRRRP